MNTSKSFKLSLSILVLVLIFVIANSRYQFGEVQQMIPIKIIWSNGGVFRVTCGRFSGKTEAESVLSGFEQSDAMTDVKNGGKVYVTKIRSGFDSTHFLNTQLAFSLETNSGRHQVIVPISEALVEKGVLDLDECIRVGQE